MEVVNNKEKGSLISKLSSNDSMELNEFGVNMPESLMLKFFRKRTNFPIFVNNMPAFSVLNSTIGIEKITEEETGIKKQVYRVVGEITGNEFNYFETELNDFGNMESFRAIGDKYSISSTKTLCSIDGESILFTCDMTIKGVDKKLIRNLPGYII